MAPMGPHPGDHHPDGVCFGPPYPSPGWDDARLARDLGVRGRDDEYLTQRQTSVLFRDETYKRVGDTTTDDGWWVSTVWAMVPDELGGPFETAVFDADHEESGIWRSKSLRDAEMMHEVIVAVIQNATWRQAFFLDQEQRMEVLGAAITERYGDQKGRSTQENPGSSALDDP